MKTWFWCCLLTLVGGMFLRYQGILLFDVLALGLGGIWVGKTLIFRETIPNIKWMVPAWIFVGWAFFSWLWNAWDILPADALHALAKWIRLPVGLLFGFVAADIYAKKEDHQSFFDNLFLIVAAVLLLGVAQFYVFPDISNMSTEGGWDPHQGRLLGTWLDPNFLGGFIAFLVPLCVVPLYTEPRLNKRKVFYGLLCVLLLWCLFLTFSRSAYLAGALALGIFFLLRDPKIILIGIMTASMGIATSERAQKRLLEFSGTVKSIVMMDTDEIDPTANLRLISWNRSLDLWRQYPVVGIGYNTYRVRAAEAGIVQEGYFSAGGSDSSHITMLVTTGVIGFVLFLWWWFAMGYSAFRAWFTHGNSLALAFGSGLSALFVHAAFVHSLVFPYIFFVVLAVGSVLASSYE